MSEKPSDYNERLNSQEGGRDAKEVNERAVCQACGNEFPIVSEDGKRYISRHFNKQEQWVTRVKRVRQFDRPDIVTDDSHMIEEDQQCPGGGRIIEEARINEDER